MEKKQQETADKKILKQEIAVYSEKYNVQGKVMDYGVVTKLVFNYDGKAGRIAAFRSSREITP